MERIGGLVSKLVYGALVKVQTANGNEKFIRAVKVFAVVVATVSFLDIFIDIRIHPNVVQ